MGGDRHTVPAMHIYDSRPDGKARLLMEMGQSVSPKKVLVDGQTALSKGLTDFQKNWLLQYCVDQWTALHSSLSGWRAKLEKFERMADDDYSDRIGRPDPEKSDAVRSIFEKQNHTLGVTSGFADFLFAQVKEDIFGTRPWIAATPQGQDDNNLADRLSKYSQYKFDQSDIEASYVDSCRAACDLGTVFVKERWDKDVETYETVDYVAHDLNGQPLTGPGGDFVRTPEELEAMGLQDGQFEWRERLFPETVTVFANVAADVLDYKDVAFDNTAPYLNLRFTDFFHRFRMGVLDAISFYKLDEEQAQALRNTLNDDRSEARAHRDENTTTNGERLSSEMDANPQVVMVDGYVRVDPFQKGSPKRIHVVFMPELQVLLWCDYLAEETPDGLLPVFPVRCFKYPGRITGRGYFEKFEDANDAIDAQYNSVTYANRRASVPISGIHRDALADENEGKDVVISPDMIYNLAPDKKLADFLEFLQYPDLSNRSIELLNQMLQMAQMRSGITSAAQGELKGVPSANTATGTRDIQSRGAVLTKVPVTQMTGDIELAAQFAVFMLCKNQDTDETFMWGEGKDAELIELKSAEVRDIKINVALTLTQSQSQNKLEASMAAANLGLQYVNLPEVDKQGQRRLYVQALAALGFNDADKIIREAATDPMAILQILPPDLAGMFQAFLDQNGLLPQVGPDGQPLAPPAGPESAAPTDAPVTDAAPPA